MREEKKLLLEEIREQLDAASSLVVTKFTNITSTESWNFRNILIKNDAEMEVVKKRVFLKAFEKSGYKCTIEELDGQIAIIFIKDDPVGAIKAIFEFSNQTDKLQVIRGEIEGKVYNKEELLFLSKLPTMNNLRAEFLSVLEAPMTGTLSTVESLLTSVMYALEEKKKLEEKNKG
ncbi:MAG: 50S ribosomal protein L10 [Candidatus Anoxychlamydiales bacterium]|nr:50S ribosomal protein L10 [Candidatus Anoxychlamydiales bacterium]